MAKNVASTSGGALGSITLGSTNSTSPGTANCTPHMLRQRFSHELAVAAIFYEIKGT